MSKISSLELFTGTIKEQLSRLRHFRRQMTTEAYLMDPTETSEEWRRLRCPQHNLHLPQGEQWNRRCWAPLWSPDTGPNKTK